MAGWAGYGYCASHSRGELTLRIGHVTDPPTVQITRGVQLHLLNLLNTDIGQTRWPQTCG